MTDSLPKALPLPIMMLTGGVAASIAEVKFNKINQILSFSLFPSIPLKLDSNYKEIQEVNK